MRHGAARWTLFALLRSTKPTACLVNYLLMLALTAGTTRVVPTVRAILEVYCVMLQNAARCRTQFFSVGFDSLRSFYVDNDEALHEVYLVAKAEPIAHILSFLRDCHGLWSGSRLG